MTINLDTDTIRVAARYTSAYRFHHYPNSIYDRLTIVEHGEKLWDIADIDQFRIRIAELTDWIDWPKFGPSDKPPVSGLVIAMQDTRDLFEGTSLETKRIFDILKTLSIAKGIKLSISIVGAAINQKLEQIDWTAPIDGKTARASLVCDSMHAPGDITHQLGTYIYDEYGVLFGDEISYLSPSLALENGFVRIKRDQPPNHVTEVLLVRVNDNGELEKQLYDINTRI